MRVVCGKEMKEIDRCVMYAVDGTEIYHMQ